MAIEKNLWTAWGKKDGEPFKAEGQVDADAVSGNTVRLTSAITSAVGPKADVSRSAPNKM